MIALPKLLLFALLICAVWYAMRWLNRPAPPVVRRRPAAPTGPQAAVEDLTACSVCGAYVATSARGCGRSGCPQPR
jgi:hypothetical protein